MQITADKPINWSHKILCLYHGPHCVDGFVAAWCVYDYFINQQNFDFDRVEFVAVDYKDRLDKFKELDFTGKDVIIVDFSFPPEYLTKILAMACRVIVLDHHKTAQQELQSLIEQSDLVHIEFNMEKSGAMMAWHFFNPEKLISFPIIYAEDYDLWTKHFKNTDAFHDAMQFMMQGYDTLEKKFIYFTNIVNGSDLNTGSAYKSLYESFITEGHKLLTARRRMMLAHVIGSVDRWKFVHFEEDKDTDVTFAVINAPYAWASELGNMIVTEYGCPVLVYTIHKDGVKFSFRSENKLFDVTKVAKKYGGGGHRNAAGANVDHATFMHIFDHGVL